MGTDLRILVTGAAGLLGAHVCAHFARRAVVVGTDRHEWWGDFPIDFAVGDLTDARFRSELLRTAAPDLIVHCAAMVNVDACEEQPADAYRLNAELTGALAREAPAKALFVYITTDGLFKGDRRFTTETDLPCPRTVYGRSKLHGEWEVQILRDRHLIIRTNFYGWSSGRKSSAVEWLYNALERREPITLYDDFYFTPLYVSDLVDRLHLLIERERHGTFHLVGAERVSKYEFGVRLAQAAGLSTEQVKRGSIRDAVWRAPRPHDMSLRSVRFEEATGHSLPDLESGLVRLIADRGSPLSARSQLSAAIAPG